MARREHDEVFTDRNGRTRRYSEKYYARKRQIRMQLAAMGIGALLVIIGIVVLIGHLTNREVQAEEPATDLQASSGAGVELEPFSELTVSADQALEEQEPEEIAKDPELFYAGYNVYKDASTKAIWSEDITSTYCILVDLKDGHVVAERNGFDVMYPASMTKVLTALVAAEHVTDPEDTFVITQEITDFAFSNGCSTANYLVGEEITLRDLFYGTIMPSGADAALALAYYTAGDVDTFVDMMNDKVAELGLSDVAHFTNPIGIHDPENYCTPAAMAMIMKAALENDLCREVLAAHIYNTQQTNMHPDGQQHSNLFLRRIEDRDSGGVVLGGKTGYVVESRNCAVSFEQSDSGNYYICVTGQGAGKWAPINEQAQIYREFAK
ncbi:MAG: D-alanyl-D-alanine carboxypeptidase [Lachnospiraceae bacterium]|nr:D-alanyl-D-alanine carboxypeptidase [Lachnospiraceae bacterium]